jgi:hypothetical protein
MFQDRAPRWAEVAREEHRRARDNVLPQVAEVAAVEDVSQRRLERVPEIDASAVRSDPEVDPEIHCAEVVEHRIALHLLVSVEVVARSDLRLIHVVVVGLVREGGTSDHEKKHCEKSLHAQLSFLSRAARSFSLLAEFSRSSRDWT